MFDFKTISGVLSIVAGIVAVIPYLNGIIHGKVKPHAFSWLVWSCLNLIVFVAQIVKHSGAGSWATGFTALSCFVFFLLAFSKGEKKFVMFDWISLTVAFISLVLWKLTSDPALSVILIALTDAFGFLPTLRKGYYKPHEDILTFWMLVNVKWLFAIIAIESYSFVTLLNPIYLFVINGAYSLLLLFRRNHQKRIN